MATRPVGTWEAGKLVAELDYDETVSPERLTGLRVNNQMAVSAYFVVARHNGTGPIYETYCPPGEVTTLNIPTGLAARIEQFQNARGQYDGVSISTTYPWVPVG